jgi:hypothetical protein
MTGLRERLVEEVREIALSTIFFAAWFLALMTLKTLVLEEYEIGFSGVAAAIVGALVAAKVVAVLRHVRILGALERGPAWLWVLARTALYTLGVLVAAALERAFETRGEHGGFGAALGALLDDPHWPHVLAGTLGAGIALFVHNVLDVVRRHVPGQRLRPMFTAPLAPVREVRSGVAHEDDAREDDARKDAAR